MKTRLIHLTLACLLVAVPATAQVNYAVSGGTAYVTSSPNASGDIVIASTYNGYPVTTIRLGAFYGCTGLTSVTIPNSVTSMEQDAFFQCTSLTSVTIPNSVTSIGHRAFYDGRSLTNVTIPNSVTSIGQLAFYQCTGLTSATIPDHVTRISENTFAGCTSLTNVTIPNSVTEIRVSAFAGCRSLTSVTIPDSVTSIEYWAFYGCASLTNISVDAANPAYRSVDGVLFNKAQTTLLMFPGGRAGSYVIPGSVSSIEFYALSQCTSLTSVTIPNSVTNIGGDAFSYCTSLTSLTIPDSVTNIYYFAFAGCWSLTNFTFLGNAPRLVYEMEVGGGWFAGVGAGAMAYYYCGTTGWGSTYGGLPTVMLCAPQVNYAVSSGTAYVTRSPNASGDIVIASTYNGYPVTSIEHDAFSRCTNLTSVTIPTSVTNVGHWVFENCTSLTSVTIPNSVTSIGFSAFIRCTSLTRVTIPASVISIGSQGFHSCTSLTNFTFLGNPPQLLFDFDGGFNQFANVGAGARVYYYCGTTGWGANYGGLPTVMLCPPQIAPDSAGIKPGGFGFTLTRLTNQTIVVEASTNLVNWQPISTNPPPGASTIFVDPEWLQHSNRFYRARSD